MRKSEKLFSGRRSTIQTLKGFHFCAVKFVSLKKSVTDCSKFSLRQRTPSSDCLVKSGLVVTWVTALTRFECNSGWYFLFFNLIHPIFIVLHILYLFLAGFYSKTKYKTRQIKITFTMWQSNLYRAFSSTLTRFYDFFSSFIDGLKLAASKQSSKGHLNLTSVRNLLQLFQKRSHNLRVPEAVFTGFPICMKESEDEIKILAI